MVIGDIVHVIGEKIYGIITIKMHTNCQVLQFGVDEEKNVYQESELELQPLCMWCEEPRGKIYFGVCKGCVFKVYLYQKKKPIKMLKKRKTYKYLNKDWK